MTYGFKVSKSGKDVKTATGDDLEMEADYTILKVFSSGTAQYNYSDGVIEITHNLGYVPHFLVYGNGGSYWPYFVLATGVKPLFEVPIVHAYADTSKIYFYVGSGTDVPVYYYIFYDQT